MWYHETSDNWSLILIFNGILMKGNRIYDNFSIAVCFTAYT